jgi:hypothetical protein
MRLLLLLKVSTTKILQSLMLMSAFTLFAISLNAQKQSNTWKSLFNGKDLNDWGTYLRPSEAAADQQPIGLNKDPHGVFTVKTI